jgi:hypothetical protein
MFFRRAILVITLDVPFHHPVVRMPFHHPVVRIPFQRQWSERDDLTDVFTADLSPASSCFIIDSSHVTPKSGTI